MNNETNQTNNPLHGKINSWEDVAREFGIDPIKSLPYPNPEDGAPYPVITYKDGTKSDPVADKKHKNACFKMEWLTRLFNDGEKVEYDNDQQYKFWGWFIKRPAGFGFVHVNARYGDTGTTVGPRLSFLKKEDLRYVANHPQLSLIYIDYHSQ